MFSLSSHAKPSSPAKDSTGQRRKFSTRTFGNEIFVYLGDKPVGPGNEPTQAKLDALFSAMGCQRIASK